MSIFLSKIHSIFACEIFGIDMYQAFYNLWTTTSDQCQQILRWYDTLKYGDAQEKFNFMKIEDLRPLNTCQKHFQTILPNFPLDECEI